MVRPRSLVNRYYDPSTSQFLSIDPEVAQTGQPYAYAGDDPLNATDPLGLARRKKKPQAPTLTEAEKKALERAAQGLPVSQKVLNAAKKKQVTQEKIQGARNVQKRQSNFVETPVPSLVMAHPYNPAQDPWAYQLPETKVNQPIVHLWLPGGTVTHDLGITGVGATVVGGAINVIAGFLEVGGAAGS